MSIITSTAAKQVGKAFALKTDQDLQMFDDLWEVYQVGHHFEKTNEKAQHAAVEKSFSAIVNIASKQAGQDVPGFGRSVMSTHDKFVIFSDFHMTDRMSRQDLVLPLQLQTVPRGPHEVQPGRLRTHRKR